MTHGLEQVQADQALGYRCDAMEYAPAYTPGPKLAADPMAPVSLGKSPALAEVKPALLYTPHTIANRRKGRWFVGLVILLMGAGVTGVIWEVFFHYQAYGVIKADMIEVAATVAGVVQRVHVVAGQPVRRGDVLVELDNIALRQQRDQIGDQLSVIRAELASNTARLKWQHADHSDRYYEAVSEYHALSAQLMKERARFQILDTQVRDIRRLWQNDAATNRELEVAEIDLDGQRASVAKFETSVIQAKMRVDTTREFIEQGDETLAPTLAQIDKTVRDLHRVEQQLEQCVIRSPSDGVVLACHRQVGEYCRVSDPVVSIPDDASLRVVLFLRQAASDRFAVDDQLRVVSEPGGQTMACRIERFANGYTQTPASIARRYRPGESLLEVYLVPDRQDDRRLELRLGQVVKLPRLW